MTEELKKAILLLKNRADVCIRNINNSIQTYNATLGFEENSTAVALITSALSTDKTLEVVKRHRDMAQIAHDSIDSWIENWDKSELSAKVVVCNAIIAEIEGTRP